MTIHKGLLAPQANQPTGGLLDPKTARLDAFLAGLGSMSGNLIAAGAPSTDPGNFGRQMAQAGQAFGQGHQSSMAGAQNRAMRDLQGRATQQQITAQQDAMDRNKQIQIARARYAKAHEMGWKDAAGNPVDQNQLLAAAYPEAMAKAHIGSMNPAPTKPLTQAAKAKQDFDNGLITQATYKSILSSVGKPGVAVNMPGKAPPMMETIGAATSEQIKDWRTKGVDSSGFRTQLSDLRTLLDRGVQTGFGQEFKNEAAKFANSFGLNVDMANLSGAEASRSLINQLVVPRVKQLGAKPTDKDLEFIVDQFPQLSNTPEGNKIILDVLEISAKRDQARSDFATTWVQKNAATDPYGMNFERDYREWSESNPLFKPYNAEKSTIPAAAPGASIDAGPFGGMSNEDFMRANPFNPSKFRPGG